MLQPPVKLALILRYPKSVLIVFVFIIVFVASIYQGNFEELRNVGKLQAVKKVKIIPGRIHHEGKKTEFTKPRTGIAPPKVWKEQVTIHPYERTTTRSVTENKKDVEQDQGTEKPLVLLVTYLRSGSTLTAEIIENGDGVFYVYEPLRFFMPQFFGYFGKDGLCFANNNTCVQLDHELTKTTTILQDIHNFYTCGFSDIHPRFLWNYNASEAVSDLRDCYKSQKQDCLPAAKKECLQKARSIKTIRMSMDLVEILLKNIPRLKVVHLLRDPRGMLYSRRRGGFLRSERDVAAHAKSLCERFENDLNIGRKLRKLYPGRLKTTLYEQIAEHPKDSSNSLFNFLNLKPSHNFEKWLHDHTSAGKSSGFYDTTRANSSKTASSWRLRWKYREVEKIDRQCRNVYNTLGFIKANAYTLANMNIPLRTKSPEFGDFL